MGVKKAILTLSMIAGVLGMTGATAMAGEVQTKIYICGPHVVDGKIQAPTVTATGPRKTAEFEALLSLKKSFIKPLLQTSKDRALK